MDSEQKLLHTIRYLISKSLDESITASESELMDQLIQTDPQARRYYVELMQVHVNLRRIHEEDSIRQFDKDSSQWDAQLWQELASYEMTAEPVEEKIDQKPKERLCAAGPIVKVKGEKPSKFSLFTLITSIAAMLLMIVYINFMPARKTVVATMTDGLNCRWAQTEHQWRPGDQILNEPMILEKGFVTLTFDYGTEVVIEAPAEFTPLAPDKMVLDRGKAFAHVPKNAIGFTIDTPFSSVVDLGTAFGVTSENNGTTEVHVYDGKVNLIAASSKQSKDSQIVSKSQARRINADTVEIESADFKQYLYVQEISSKDNRIVYGDPISLASLVAGGDGFTIGDRKTGIDPSTGLLNQKAAEDFDRFGSGKYCPVPARNFIDGVFVPDGPSIVTSQGHSFNGFPDTTASFWLDITANPIYNFSAFNDSGQLVYEIDYVATLDDDDDVTVDSANPVILMHPNAGITFDMEKIRQKFPEAHIAGLTARCGITANAITRMQHEYWVLIDGLQVFNYYQSPDDQTVCQIDIPISDNQRFLTLAVTEGADNTSFDWCLFDNIYLELVPKGIK